jgi:hypothetical protein
VNYQVWEVNAQFPNDELNAISEIKYPSIHFEFLVLGCIGIRDLPFLNILFFISANREMLGQKNNSRVKIIPIEK